MDNIGPFARVDYGCALAQAIVDTIREPLLVLDKDLYVVAASRSFYVTFAMNHQDVQGHAFYALGDGQWNIPELRRLLERILPLHSVLEGYEVERDFGQGRRIMRLNARTVFSEGAQAKLILLGVEDVTEAHATTMALKNLLQQKDVLLLEMQHRVANSLQIIASVLLLKAATVQSEETRLHLHDAHRRVMSVAAVQEQLRASRQGDKIELAPYLSKLCESLAASMIGETRPVSVTVQAEAGSASSSDAVSIGLVVTELVINALKHAFAPDKVDGRIVVSYEVAASAWRLTVSDNGRGMASGVGAPRPGLGTRIVEALSSQLDAEVKVSSSSGGTRIAFTHGVMPISLTRTA